MPTISWRPINVSKLVAEHCPVWVSSKRRFIAIRILIFSLLNGLESECEQISCPVSNKRYLERGCRPEYKGRACCPTSFTCRKFPIKISMKFVDSKIHFHPAEDKPAVGVCHYGGITYKVGQRIDPVTLDYPCKTDCYCVSSSQQ